MTEGQPTKRLRFNPEVSLGHILEIVLVIIPAVIYIVRIDARLDVTEKTVQKLVQQDEKTTESISLLSKNQAVFAALFEAHQKDKQKNP